MNRAAPVHDREHAAPENARIEIRVWLRLLTCATLLEGEVRKLFAERFATTIPRFDVLAQLVRYPDGLAMGELSRRMMVSNGNVTGLVERLVGEKLVERIARPEDRRANIVRLTNKGRAEFDRIVPEHHALIEAMLGGLPKADLRRLYELLGEAKESITAGKRKGRI